MFAGNFGYRHFFMSCHELKCHSCLTYIDFFMKKNSKQLSQYVFVMAHGAGADKSSEWMVAIAERLNELGLQTIRFNFPYMIKRAEDGKRRPPDRQPKLLASFQEQIERLPQNKKLIIGGKSMGGRMASLLAVETELAIEGVICLGFPFHPPGKPEKFRGEHLVEMSIPTLILQGERDTFGNRQEIEQMQFSKQVSVDFLVDGDHSFKPRVRSGYTLTDNLHTSCQKILQFVHSL